MQQEYKNLQWLIESGADEAITDSPINRFESNSNQENKKPTNIDKITLISDKDLNKKNENHSQPTGNQHAISQAEENAKNCNSIDELETAINNFNFCSLKNTAQNTVYYRGTNTPKILCIGLSPNKQDDKNGIPFSGDVNLLIDRMFKSAGFDIETIAFTNSVFWYPPGERAINTQEYKINKPFLFKTIELANPDIIIVFGNELSKYIFNETALKLRGKITNLKINKDFRAFVLYSARQMFNIQAYKKQVWHDLKRIKEYLNND